MQQMNVVAYYRVSTSAQGDSGLGLEAQREYVATAAKSNGWSIIGEFVEVGVSGTVAIEERPQGSLAIAQCKAEGATLVVAKLDRISRDVEHVARLLKVAQFKVATMPHADSFQLHLFAALAQQEREFIAQRTRDALQALQQRADEGDAVSQQKIERRSQALAKGRTGAVGDNARAKAAESVASRVDGFHRSIEHHLQACLFQGLTSLRQVAACLNTKGITTARGGEWNATQVSRAMSSLSLSFPA